MSPNAMRTLFITRVRLRSRLPQTPSDQSAFFNSSLGRTWPCRIKSSSNNSKRRGKELGISIGRAAALAILNLRANDGWNAQPPMNTSYPQGTAPGEYRFTPGTPFAFLTYWGTVRPFALTSSAQYRPPNPYPIDSKRYTRDYNEIKALGGDGITTPNARTADQTEIALFWLESSPPGMEPHCSDYFGG